MDLTYLGTLDFAGKVSMWLSLITFGYAIPQIKDYWRVFRNKALDKDTRIHTFKLIVLVCGIMGFCLSVFGYSLQLVSLDGQSPFRLELKWLQNFSIFGIACGLHGLRKYYIDRL